MQNTSVIRESLSTPVTMKAEVAVAGGGVAGISAALAAARNGADVLLVEGEYLLGGLATLGLVTYYLPLCDGRGHQVVFGIPEELLRLSVKHGCEKDRPDPWLDGGSIGEKTKKRFKAGYNGNLFALECERLLLSEGVRLLYGTRVVSAVREGSRVTHLICENKSGRFAIETGRVIDATGDADVAHLCGAPTALPAHGNILAAWYYWYRDGERRLKMYGGSDIPEDERGSRPEKKKLSETRYSGLDGEENSRYVIDSHAALYADWSERRLAEPGIVPDHLAVIPQLRMTRKIAGRATPDVSDERRAFGDSVGVVSDWRRRGPVYEIPFGSLCPEGVVNLLAAGRIVSVSDALWDNTRSIPCCSVTGTAAGTA
ncbi:MAG: FAD-dependent oxidoreductase, partial [Clostridia bacterium]|nr:FAD-dependent oxidoreductase [Clostridia bacterium]